MTGKGIIFYAITHVIICAHRRLGRPVQDQLLGMHLLLKCTSEAPTRSLLFNPESRERSTNVIVPLINSSIFFEYLLKYKKNLIISYYLKIQNYFAKPC